MRLISRSEEYVLLSAHELRGRACLIEIREQLNEITGKNWSVSSVYVPLNKLEKKGYLRTETGEPTLKRGGKAVKYYFLTEEGKNILGEIRAINEKVWSVNWEKANETE